MIQLKLRTEHSFGLAYGKIPKVLDAVCKSGESTAAAITDRGGTWGHISWARECAKRKIKPIFGVELALVKDMLERTRQPISYVVLLAQNKEGLRKIYHITSLANQNFYEEARIDKRLLEDTTDIIVLLDCRNPSILPSGNVFVQAHPRSEYGGDDFNYAAVSDNFFPCADDRKAYELAMGRQSTSCAEAQHILTEAESVNLYSGQAAYQNTLLIANDMCEAFELDHAEPAEIFDEYSLKDMCISGAQKRGVDLNERKYAERLDMELKEIEAKGFSDYFFIVADMVQHAKKQMLVGAARGSSSGSLVCYLLGITEINPIPHNLIFERFIDVNRADLPDIDIDFQDDKRQLIFDYLKQKYGEAKVARLGTIARWQPRSVIGEGAKMLRVPEMKISELKNTIIKRNPGDDRADLCVKDALIREQSLIKAYPHFFECAKIEGHAKHKSQHAAALVITKEPINLYCAIDENGTAQLDKYDAESLNLLKIDVLGLKTLTIIAET